MSNGDPSEVHVAIRWQAGDGLQASDVLLVTPAVQDEEEVEDLLDQACLRLEEYTHRFHRLRIDRQGNGQSAR